jgi:hypothetical protein
VNYICSFPVWESIEVYPDESVADRVQAHVQDLTGETTLVDADLVTGAGWVCRPGDLVTPFQIEQITADRESAIAAASSRAS